MILAAGRGRRMGRLTADRPKGALEIGGHALIDWQIETLRAAGIHEIAVVTGHASEALFGRDVDYIHNSDWASGTQVETLLRATGWIGDEPVIVSYSDILYHPSAVIALLERPGEIVVGYDADHRWLWKRRFGNWLRDSETFRLGPGQTLVEIGGKPRDIEELDGQFMGLMLLSPEGLASLAEGYRSLLGRIDRRPDFTAVLGALVERGAKVDTAANLLPWMEIDSPKDLRLGRAMTQGDAFKGVGAQLIFPAELLADLNGDPGEGPGVPAADAADIPAPASHRSHEAMDGIAGNPFAAINDYRVEGVFAVQNWGRSGSTLVQSLFDNHPQILSTPNFYSRYFYTAWATTIGRLDDADKVDAFLHIFRQWWDTGLVDATAGLHRLGPGRREIAGVERERLEGFLRAALPPDRPITRRGLFTAAHLAYALARGQTLSSCGLRIMFPIHGEPRGVAAVMLEDFPDARFLHTIREPVSNIASTIRYYEGNGLDIEANALTSTLGSLLCHVGSRYGRRSTVFAISPYFRWLVAADQVRAIRLEDIHADAQQAMSRVARWLSIADDGDTLTDSSWDGKKWWNRPESGRDSLVGTADPKRHIAANLSPRDVRRVARLFSRIPLVRSAYPCPAPGIWSRLVALAPAGWRAEHRVNPSRLRALLGLKGLRPFLTRRLDQVLTEQVARERYRAHLMALGTGSVSVRKKLPDARKPGTITATLLLSARGKEWRARALLALDMEQRRLEDRLAAVFLDEATRRPSIRHHLAWASILLVGGSMARVRSWVTVRRMTFRQPLPSGRSPEMRLIGRGPD